MPAAYARGAIAFHWTLAALIMTNAGLALFRETFAAQAVRMISAHKAIGLAILAIAICHSLWRRRHPPPPFLPGIGRWEAVAAKAVHRLMRLLMIAVPMAGWVFTSLTPATRPLDYRGLASVPRLPLATSDTASFAWHEAHELMGFAMVGLFLIHIAAALKHQFFDRVNVIGRMTP